MSLELYNRYNLSKFARVQYYSYQDDGAQLDFQNYLDLWSFNPKYNLISIEDDQATSEQLNNLKNAQHIAKFASFLSMGLLYYVGNGFQTNLPWYFKYPRHIICLTIGTIILPKYLIGNRYNEYFIGFKEKQNKYNQQILSQQQDIEEIKQNFKKPEYLIQMIQADQNLQNQQNASSEDSNNLEDILKNQKSK
ncbi:hypothetical protein TTHERM_00070940 (macronuclear) [Tetrahymena thermophila SB210]|uniref:Uncharacterized protein n=1 Tax=Tetrahymena thermophila (strain SB210) TaxID=312017 RepID=I7MDH3_TETTS|nr:hypothetical protein TTHERM_00070940 [Tetrahymena thermophila SB210]EAR87587.2 hypothetical protein TTHERM_00070940 [Tetrahymena thermophila SB210]|eukprot:XP_001007832.2 hypothetical protein TTHERM_00070940 [Tetrahymena thermophila SB210]